MATDTPVWRTPALAGPRHTHPAKTATKTTATKTTTTAAPSQADSAFQAILGFLSQHGLDAFAGIAWDDYKNSRDDVNLIVSDIRASTQYAQVFGAGAADLIKQGLFSSEGAIDAYHSQIKDLFSYYGIPANVTANYTSADNLNKLALGHVSPNEIEGRLKLAQDSATASLNPDQRAELQRTTGVTTGDLTGFWLDPANGLGEAQNKYNAALIGAAGDQAGYGQIDVGRLLSLAGQGVSQSQAEQGFGTLAGEQSLFQALPGQATPTISQDDQLSAAFGNNAAANAQIEAARRQRLAAFAGSGGPQASAQGVVGIGQNVT